MIQPVVEAPEREVKQPMDCGIVKMYTPGVGQACGELESVSCGHKWLLGGNTSCCTVQLPDVPS
jgi:hypothetical protein